MVLIRNFSPPSAGAGRGDDGNSRRRLADRIEASTYLHAIAKRYRETPVPNFHTTRSKAVAGGIVKKRQHTTFFVTLCSDKYVRQAISPKQQGMRESRALGNSR